MSEDRSRFRIKKGDIEIEYEGKSTEVTTRYEEAFEWIKAVTITPSRERPSKEEKKAKEKKAGEKRGGTRTGVIAPGIDKLIEEGFFDNFKNSTEVLGELRRKTVPVSHVTPVIVALNRRVSKKLDRIRDEQGRWVYRKRQSTGG